LLSRERAEQILGPCVPSANLLLEGEDACTWIGSETLVLWTIPPPPELDGGLLIVTPQDGRAYRAVWETLEHGWRRVGAAKSAP
jgi:hypothetical protein